MALTITLPDRLEHQLEQAAIIRQLTIEETAINLLDDVLGTENAGPSPEDVVARIKVLPATSSSLRPARGSLGKALRASPENPDFDLAAWQQAWTAVEAGMKAITRANDIAEGRR